MNLIKPRVILCQLNSADNTYTIPLAAGYLKAVAHAAGLTKLLEIEILTRYLNNAAGDSAIVAYLVDRKPCLIGFSCYVWNIERTMHIIQRVKKLLPDTEIVCGGTEVSTGFRRIMESCAADVVVFGEGELVFIDLLRHVLSGSPRMEEIRGIAYRARGLLAVTQPRPQIPDINVIPSPYLLGFIDPCEYQALMIETYRGCMGRCSYCNWRRNFSGVRFFSAQRIKKEMQLAIKKQVSVHPIDTIFNLPANILRLNKVLGAFTRKRSFEIVSEGRAEYINKKTIKGILRANLAYMTIGLQSVNQAALRNVNRWFNKKLFIRGIKLLKSHRIPLRIDVIIGLPGDNAKTIRETLRFVQRYNSEGDNYFDILNVPPETELARQAGKFKLKYSRTAPYYIRSTKDLKFRELQDIWAQCMRFKSNSPVQKKILPDKFSKPLYSIRRQYNDYMAGFPENRFPYFSQEAFGSIRPYSEKSYFKDKFTVDIMLEVDITRQSQRAWLRLAQELAASAGLITNLYFKCINVDSDLTRLGRFIAGMSLPNPFTKFNFFIEADDRFPLSSLCQLRKYVTHTLTYNEKRQKFYNRLLGSKSVSPMYSIIALFPFSTGILRGKKELCPEVMPVPFLSISKDKDWKPALTELSQLKNHARAIDFGGDPDTTIEALLFMHRQIKNDAAFIFCDPAAQCFHSVLLAQGKMPSGLLQKLKDIAFQMPPEMLYIDAELKKTVRCFDLTVNLVRALEIYNAYLRRKGVILKDAAGQFMAGGKAAIRV